MKFIKSKKALALLSVIAVVAIAAVGAYAYFAGNGSGTGSASVGTVAHDITVSSTTSGALFPLDAAPAPNTDITVTNAGTGHEFVNTVTETSITTNKPTSGLPGTYCDPSWFEFDTNPVAIGKDLAPLTGTYTKTGAATLWLVNDSGVDQSGCEGAAVTVNYTSN